DPRRWDNCGLFWDPPDDATKYAVVDLNGVPVRDPSDPTNLCKVKKSTQPEAPIGAPFQPRPLFEDFSLSNSSTGLIANFNNVLTVSAADENDAILGPIHRVTYSLPPNGYLCGQIDGVHTVVSVDGGHLWDWTQNGRTWVEFHKEM